ncbi:hypothetical protein T484DRAFT_3400487 [Baffinella frigidus]|nr:hypothetical protein T484DRAFT_3400487 [Cryptophyta sp. CCMP2293]
MPLTATHSADPPLRPTEGWVFCRTTRSASAAQALSAGDPDAEMQEHFRINPQRGKLRSFVKAIVFVNTMSRKGNGVRNAGVHKATNRPIGSPSRQLQVTKSKMEPAEGIPLRWGGVEKLEQHCIGPTGTKERFIFYCQTTIVPLLHPVSAAHTSIFRMDSNSTSYRRQEIPRAVREEDGVVGGGFADAPERRHDRALRVPRGTEVQGGCSVARRWRIG